MSEQMSEQIIIDAHLVSPDMRGPVTPGQELDPSTVSATKLSSEAGVLPVGEQDAPVAESDATVLNPDRALSRLGARLMKFGERRTTKQVASEKAGQARDFASEKLDNTVAGTKKVATKVGNATLTAGVLTIDTGLKKADKLSTAASELKTKAVSGMEAKKDSFVENVKTRATAAKERKEARVTARAEAKAANVQLRADRTEKRAFQKASKVYESQREKDFKKLFDAASTSNKAMLKDAYSDNKKFDKNQKSEDRRERIIKKGEEQLIKYAEQDKRRTERNQKIGKAVLGAAKAAGNVGLITGILVADGAKYTAEKTVSGAKRTIEVAGDVGNVVHVTVRRAQIAASEQIVATNVSAKRHVADARINRINSKRDKHMSKALAYEAKLSSPVK